MYSNYYSKSLVYFRKVGDIMEDNHIEDWKELGYESEEEFLEDLLDCDENWTLEDYFASLPEW